MSANINYVVCSPSGQIELVCNGDPGDMEAQVVGRVGWFVSLGPADQDTEWIDPVTYEVLPKQQMTATVPVGTQSLVGLPPETTIVINDDPITTTLVTDGEVEDFGFTEPGLYEITCTAPTYFKKKYEIEVLP